MAFMKKITIKYDFLIARQPFRIRPFLFLSLFGFEHVGGISQISP